MPNLFRGVLQAPEKRLFLFSIYNQFGLECFVDAVLRPGLGNDLDFTVGGVTSNAAKVLLDDLHFLQVQKKLVPAQVEQLGVVHLPDRNHFGTTGCPLDNQSFGAFPDDVLHGYVNQQAVHDPVDIGSGNVFAVKTVDPTGVGSNKALDSQVRSRFDQGRGLRVHDPRFVGYLQSNCSILKDGAIDLIVLKYILGQQFLGQVGGILAANALKTKNPGSPDFFYALDTQGVVNIIKDFFSLAVGYSRFGNNPHLLDH